MNSSTQQFAAKKALEVLGLIERPGFPSFQEFSDDWFPHYAAKLLADRTPHGVQDPDFVASMHAFHAALIVAKAGDPVFELSPDLIQALRDTEVPNTPSEEVKLPFEGINIDFPKGTLAAPAHEVDRIMLIMTPGDRFRVVYHHDQRTNYVNFIPHSGQTLNQCIEYATNHRWDDVATPGVKERFLAEVSYDDYWKTDMFRLAINTMLYITSPDSDVIVDKKRLHTLHTKLQGLKKSRKRDALERQIARVRRNKRYIVGAKFRLSKEYNADLTSSGKKWALEQRVRVMGHFKSQPHGSQKKERKLIWIAPYWRGLSYAEMMERKYIVTSPKG